MASQQPQDLLAEQSVLGSILLSRPALNEVMEILRPEHFYKPNHETIYRAIIDLTSKGEPADAVTVNAALTAMGKIRNVGQTYILDLIQTVGTAANVSYYARIVHDKWRLRKLIEVCTRGVQLGYTEASTTADVDLLIGEAERQFRELDDSPGSIGIEELISSWRKWTDDPLSVIPSPWPEFNQRFLGGGYRKGKLYIVGAPPGVGKSAWGLNSTLKALEDKRRAQIVSLEMPREEVASRLIAAGGYASYAEIFRKSLGEETHLRAEEWIDNAQAYQLDVNDSATLTVEEIGAGIRRYKPDIVFVDYLQLVQPTDHRVQREQQVAHISSSLKRLAKDCKTAIIAASQLNDNGDLRESRKQLMDADFVVVLEPGPGTLKAVVKKNRDGKKGQMDLVFRGDVQRIGD